MKPSPIVTTVPVVQKLPATRPAIVVPSKRPAALTNEALHKFKRTKPIPISIPSPAWTIPQGPLSALSPKVAEQRKRLEALQKKRKETAAHQLTVNEQMEPHLQRLAEEHEELTAQLKEEEMAYAEEAQRLTASLELLKEFEGDNGSD